MELHLIKTEKAYQELLVWIDQQLDLNLDPNSKQGKDLELALLLIQQYEDLYYPIPKPDAIEVVKLKMQEKGLMNKDLVNWIGSKGYVSGLLNRKKPLTLRIAKILHQELGIPAEILLA